MSDGSNDGVDLIRQHLQKLNGVVSELCEVAKDKEEKLKVFEGQEAPATVEGLQQKVNELRKKLAGICDAMSAQEKLQKEVDDEIELKKYQQIVLRGEIDDYVEKSKDLQDEFERLTGEFASRKKMIRRMKAEMETEKKKLQLLPQGQGNSNVLLALNDLYEQKTQLIQQFNKDFEDTRNELAALLNSNIGKEVADLQTWALDLQLAAKSISRTQGRRCALKELMYKVNHVTEQVLEELQVSGMSQAIADCIVNNRKPLECQQDLIANGLDFPIIGQWVLNVAAPAQ